MCIADPIFKTYFGFIVAENSSDHFFSEVQSNQDVIDNELKKRIGEVDR